MSDNSEKLAPLSLGSVSFTALREAGEIYVDKTDRVAQLATVRRKLFIARPRRFGKSLLLATFKALFQDGLRNFAGLKIESVWHDKTYPVVHLDFSKFKEFGSEGEFRRAIERHLAARFGLIGFRYDPKAFCDIYEQLQIWLESQPSSFYVLLIDEYDAPLSEHLDDPEVFRKIRRILSTFYAMVKTTEGSLRFLFMTGITKYSQTGIFSELNITDDQSLSADYATLFGYTEKEIRNSFGGYLRRAARVLSGDTKQWTVDDVLREIRRNYDGYCFDGTLKEHVYNPWSVMKFLDAPKAGFDNYWIKSGGLTTGLIKYFKTHELRDPEDFQVEKRLPKAVLEASSSEENLSDVALLTQMGYLTLKRSEAGDFYVGYPNEEVASAMAALYSENLLNGGSLSQAGAGGIGRLLAEGAAEAVVGDFNKLFASLDYLRYPVRDEYTCRGYLFAMLKGAQLQVGIEVHNAFGRSDLELDAGKYHWVFELKFQKKGASSETASQLLEAAAGQIRSKHYGEQTTRSESIRVAMVFAEDARQFVLLLSVPM